ncbi:MAG: universal stress protein [Nitrospirae bacterium]|nr:universal stress protein [Nitrospirota bacterium]MBI5739547.1 universal stress protein [Nitrospirota bacterium]
MKGYRKILIAMNGSKDVLVNGLKLAGDEKCWVTVVKVISPYEGDLNLTGIKNLEDVFSNGSGRAVSEMFDVARSEGALIKARVEEGEIDKKIVEVAQEERCDVIIMGSRKRSWLRTIFGDNVVEKVIQQAPCPVLVV